MSDETEKPDEDVLDTTGATPGDDSEQVLSQEEITSLIGSANEGGKSSADLNFLINNSKISHERLPMLEVVFDRLVRNLTTSLRNYAAISVDVSVEEMTSVRFGDYLGSVSLPAMLIIFRAEEWGSSSLLTVDPDLVYTFVDSLLGGASETNEGEGEGRSFTSIERNIVKDISDIVFADFTQAFSAIEPVTFSYDRTESTPSFAEIVRPMEAAILTRVSINIEGRGGYLNFCIPYASIEPVRDQIVQMFMGEKSGVDNIWEKHLQHEVWDAEVKVDAVLGEVSVPLGEVLNWKKGSQVILRTKPHSIINASVGEMDVLSGRMGRRDGYVSLRIDDNLIRNKLQKLYAQNKLDSDPTEEAS